MAKRLLTYALLMVVAVGGVLPLLGAYRCPTMGRRAADSCCHPVRAEGDPLPAAPDGEARIAPRCCDSIDAPTLEARAGASRDPLADGQPFQLVGALLPAAPRLVAAALHCRRLGEPRGRPPGDLLHQLSPVLRV